MNFAAIADIHGNLLALEAVLADIARRGISTIVNLGDLLSGPLWPAETADRLQSLNLPTVSGNHERQLLTLPREKMGLSDQYTIDAISKDHVAWLTTLPATLALQDDVFLCHGTPQDDLTYFLEEVTKEGVREASLQMVTARAEGCTPRASLDPTVNPSSSIPYGQTKVPEPQPRLLSTRQPDYRRSRPSPAWPHRSCDGPNSGKTGDCHVDEKPLAWATWSSMAAKRCTGIRPANPI